MPGSDTESTLVISGNQGKHPNVSLDHADPVAYGIRSWMLPAHWDLAQETILGSDTGQVGGPHAMRGELNAGP